MQLQNLTISSLLLVSTLFDCAEDEDPFEPQNYWVGRWKVNAI